MIEFGDCFEVYWIDPMQRLADVAQRLTKVLLRAFNVVFINAVTTKLPKDPMLNCRDGAVRKIVLNDHCPGGYWINHCQGRMRLKEARDRISSRIKTKLVAQAGSGEGRQSGRQVGSQSVSQLLHT